MAKSMIQQALSLILAQQQCQSSRSQKSKTRLTWSRSASWIAKWPTWRKSAVSATWPSLMSMATCYSRRSPSSSICLSSRNSTYLATKYTRCGSCQRLSKSWTSASTALRSSTNKSCALCATWQLWKSPITVLNLWRGLSTSPALNASSQEIIRFSN